MILFWSFDLPNTPYLSYFSITPTPYTASATNIYFISFIILLHSINSILHF